MIMNLNSRSCQVSENQDFDFEKYFQENSSQFVVRDRLPMEEFLKDPDSNSFHSFVWLINKVRQNQDRYGDELVRDVVRQINSLSPLDNTPQMDDDQLFACLKPRLAQSPSEVERYISRLSDGRLSYQKMLEDFVSRPVQDPPKNESNTE